MEFKNPFKSTETEAENAFNDGEIVLGYGNDIINKGTFAEFRTWYYIVFSLIILAICYAFWLNLQGLYMLTGDYITASILALLIDFIRTTAAIKAVKYYHNNYYMWKGMAVIFLIGNLVSLGANYFGIKFDAESKKQTVSANIISTQNKALFNIDSLDAEFKKTLPVFSYYYNIDSIKAAMRVEINRIDNNPANFYKEVMLPDVVKMKRELLQNQSEQIKRYEQRNEQDKAAHESSLKALLSEHKAKLAKLSVENEIHAKKSIALQTEKISISENTNQWIGRSVDWIIVALMYFVFWYKKQSYLESRKHNAVKEVKKYIPVTRENITIMGNTAYNASNDIKDAQEILANAQIAQELYSKAQLDVIAATRATQRQLETPYQNLMRQYLENVSACRCGYCGSPLGIGKNINLAIGADETFCFGTNCAENFKAKEKNLANP